LTEKCSNPTFTNIPVFHCDPRFVLCEGKITWSQ